MVFTILLGVFFAALVFLHYLQGFFSSTISAILAIFAAVLAFSWHEKIVETLLQGKYANVAHSVVLVGLFAIIYMVLRIIVDKVVQGRLTLPIAVDVVGAIIMGCVASAFAIGIIAIAAEELPVGPSVAGYTKYATEDKTAQIPGSGGQNPRGFNFDELTSPAAGEFDETRRQQTFPIILPGLDELVVGTVAHLSNGGALASSPITDIHPDFLQELYAQNIGIQPGAKHVAVNTSAAPDIVVISGLYSTIQHIQVGAETVTTRAVQIAEPYNMLVRSQPVQLPPGFVNKANSVSIPVPKNALPITIQYGVFPPGDKHSIVVVRISFGYDAADADNMIRLSPGSVRLVAKKDGVPHNYYPIGTIEPVIDPKVFPNKRFEPILYADKPDDYLLIPVSGNLRPTVDMAFAVDNEGCVRVQEGTPTAFEDGVFIEVKRMVRQSLSGSKISDYAAPDPTKMKLGTLSQRSSMQSRQNTKIQPVDVPARMGYATTAPAAK